MTLHNNEYLYKQEKIYHTQEMNEEQITEYGNRYVANLMWHVYSASNEEFKTIYTVYLFHCRNDGATDLQEMHAWIQI